MKLIDTQEVVATTDENRLLMDLLIKGSVSSVTYLTCKQGFVLGNHFHKYTTRYSFVLKGKILLVSQKENHPIAKRILEKGEMCITQPMEKYAYFALEDTELLVLAKGPSGNTEFESDTYPVWEPLIR